MSDKRERFVFIDVDKVVFDTRFDVVRVVSDVFANVVWNTDNPRHTVKNSIILFILLNHVSKFIFFWAREKNDRFAFLSKKL